MRRPIGVMRFAAGLIGMAMAMGLQPGNAVANPAAPGPASGDAGYVVTGSHLGVVETWVRLPDASRFARELGSLSASVQLWTPRTVIDLKLSACTDPTCRPGGRSARRRYRAVLTVYSRKDGAVVCSTAAQGRSRCPGTPASWNRARIAPRRTVMLSLVYTVPWTSVFAGVGNQQYSYPVTASVPARPTMNFVAARIGVELGTSPWTAPLLRAPASSIPLMSFDRPPPPPYAAEIANLNGKAGGIISRWWAHHRVRTLPASSPTAPRAAPGPLWDNGYGLTVYLER